MKYTDTKIILMTCAFLFSMSIDAEMNAENNPAVVPMSDTCRQVQQQCKSNAITASQCMIILQVCYAHINGQKKLEQVTTPTPENTMTDGRPEAPVDDGKTTTTPDNSHPDWHFGN